MKKFRTLNLTAGICNILIEVINFLLNQLSSLSLMYGALLMQVCGSLVCSELASKQFCDCRGKYVVFKRLNANKYRQKQNIEIDKNRLWMWEMTTSIFFQYISTLGLML